MTMRYLLFGCDVIYKKMRTHYIVLLLIPFFSFSQKTISVNYKKWNLKSYPESKINVGGSEGYYYDNISEPQMDLYLAKGKAVTDKAMIICPGGGLYFLSYVKEGIEQAISRGLAYAPYADLIWCETATPNLEEAKKFADAIHDKFPGKLLAYNCSPSFNWKKHLSDSEIATFQQKISAMGYKFQFITLAGFHTQNIAIFELAEKYKKEGMTAYSRIQQQEFAREKDGYTSVKHQREVGTSYFDAVSNTISGGKSSTTAMEGSTEKEQF